ncbi:hypothetical protein RRG08_055566 [Elysia crispata]|uniref:Uncharacterized protein n=1 Tax=Elysia crispata TaxID=231223 RepID=A0AAE1AEG1_9GAST|nr:hypothetical protein RRG08_055566 [Elysia crispata]
MLMLRAAGAVCRELCSEWRASLSIARTRCVDSTLGTARAVGRQSPTTSRFTSSPSGSEPARDNSVPCASLSCPSLVYPTLPHLQGIQQVSILKLAQVTNIKSKWDKVSNSNPGLMGPTEPTVWILMVTRWACDGQRPYCFGRSPDYTA